MVNNKNGIKKNNVENEDVESDESFLTEMKADIEKDKNVRCQIVEKQSLHCRVFPTTKKIEEDVKKADVTKEVKEVKA